VTFDVLYTAKWLNSLRVAGTTDIHLVFDYVLL